MRFLINGYDDSSPSTTAESFNGIVSGLASNWGSVETSRSIPVPSAVALKDLYVKLNVAPGAGKSWIFAVIKNGTATSLSVTISDAATTGNMTGQNVSFAAGDTISIGATPSGTPASTSRLSWSIVGSTTGAFFPVFGTSLGNPDTEFAAYSQLQGSGRTPTWVLTEIPIRQIVPLSGTIRDLYVTLSAAPGAGKSYAFRIMHNGAATGPEVVIADAATSGQDLVTTRTVSPGDSLAFRSTPSAGFPNLVEVRWSFKCIPDTPGESFIMYGSADPPSTAATEFELLQGGGGSSWNAVEGVRTSIFAGGTAKAMYVLVGTAPGLGSDWTFTLRQEVADTALTVTISGLATTGNAATDVVLTPGSSCNWECTPDPTIVPASMTDGAHLGLKIFFTPDALVDPMRSGGMVVPYER